GSISRVEPQVLPQPHGPGTSSPVPPLVDRFHRHLEQLRHFLHRQQTDRHRRQRGRCHSCSSRHRFSSSLTQSPSLVPHASPLVPPAPVPWHPWRGCDLPCSGSPFP